MIEAEMFMNVNIVLVKHEWQRFIPCAVWTLTFKGKNSLQKHLSHFWRSRVMNWYFSFFLSTTTAVFWLCYNFINGCIL